MTPKFIISLLLASAACLQGAPRLWMSADGQRAVPGDFLNRDATSVTIRQAEDKVVTVPLAKLHQADRTWLNTNHPLPGAPAITPVPPVPPVAPAAPAAPAISTAAELATLVPKQATVRDQLVFGDTRDQVLAKLKASPVVEMNVGDTFLGRTGLNGIFRTRKRVGGLNASLFFDWTIAGELRELTLQTDALPASAYPSRIASSWKEFIVLLRTLYGKPTQQGSLPTMGSLSDGSFTPSHLWSLESGGSALLGTARAGSNYQLVVRFTQKTIKPVALP